MPFITFYYKAFPRVLETAVKHPWRFLPYVVGPMLLSSYVAGLYDVEEEDVETLKKALPEWLQESGTSILPYKDEEGRWQVLNWSYFAPWTVYQQLAGQLAEGDFKEALGTSGLMGGPVPDMIAAIQTNKDPFSGREIIRKGSPPEEQAHGPG